MLYPADGILILELAVKLWGCIVVNLPLLAGYSLVLLQQWRTFMKADWKVLVASAGVWI